jgi:hypothetical protein
VTEACPASAYSITTLSEINFISVMGAVTERELTLTSLRKVQLNDFPCAKVNSDIGKQRKIIAYRKLKYIAFLLI